MEDINSPCELQNHSEDEMRMTTTYPNSPMMLESDMKDIIFNFQQTIEQIQSECDKMRPRRNQLAEKMSQISQRKRDLLSKLGKIDLEKIEKVKELSERQPLQGAQLAQPDLLNQESLKQTEQQKQQEIQQQRASISNIFADEVDTRESLLAMLAIYEEEGSVISALDQNKRNLIQRAQECFQLIKNQNQKGFQKKFCSKCKSEYSPLCNNETACSYHDGKMKFYSCHFCNADQYYDCCNSCLKCNKGCKQGLHCAKE